MAKLKRKKVINKRQGKEDVLTFAAQLSSEAAHAPDMATKNYYLRMARDILVAHEVHFATTR